MHAQYDQDGGRWHFLFNNTSFAEKFPTYIKLQTWYNDCLCTVTYIHQLLAFATFALSLFLNTYSGMIIAGISKYNHQV